MSNLQFDLFFICWYTFELLIYVCRFRQQRLEQRPVLHLGAPRHRQHSNQFRQELSVRENQLDRKKIQHGFRIFHLGFKGKKNELKNQLGLGGLPPATRRELLRRWHPAISYRGVVWRDLLRRRRRRKTTRFVGLTAGDQNPSLESSTVLSLSPITPVNTRGKDRKRKGKGLKCQQMCHGSWAPSVQYSMYPSLPWALADWLAQAGRHVMFLH